MCNEKFMNNDPKEAYHFFVWLDESFKAYVSYSP